MTTVPVTCRSCGVAPREGARFCDACGAALAASADVAEYKQVTVLFADVVRSMDLAAALDAERLREVITEVVQRCAAVARRYGAMVEYTGDGVMAIFGAPIALEDHAFRACVSALAIHEEVAGLAAEVGRRDGVQLQLRVGLNSGQVIAGEIRSGTWGSGAWGSGALGYRATGSVVGMARRMESAAPLGGVMLSEATAQLVAQSVMVSEPEMVRIKGSQDPVRTRLLLGIGQRRPAEGRAEARLLGRRWEMAALDALLERTESGRGGVVNVLGPPGIGKSRLAREAAMLAAARGLPVYWTFCESHTSDVPFGAVTQLLRAGSGVGELRGEAARMRARLQLPDADPQDLLLLDDLLGIADPEVSVPQLDPDVRRRRLTELVNTASVSRQDPVLFVIEDVHWIDQVSESMVSEFLTVIPQSKILVLITARPEYQGMLRRLDGAQTIALDPLGKSDTEVLLTELLGDDPSVDSLAVMIGERAGGNPFFVEEMVRELVHSGVLSGRPGAYTCAVDRAEVSVPATVQAAIEARIDRLSAAGKRTLTAASVIGGRFGAELLAAVHPDPVLGELVDAELLERVSFAPSSEYAFRHPLIHAVAYESQLKSDRAEWHRRLAAAIERRQPELVDDNAALIAEHLEAGGELAAAYTWRMRAGAWFAGRDVSAARGSWERAGQIADALPGGLPDTLSMRIAPRTMLCATDWWSIREGRGRFDELRELCAAAGDKLSLAIGMAGQLTELQWAGRSRDALPLAAEQLDILESEGSPALVVGLGVIPYSTYWDAGEFEPLLSRVQIGIDAADGDPTLGAEFGFGSPLALAIGVRGMTRGWLGVEGARQDAHDAFDIARNMDTTTQAMVAAFAYGQGNLHGLTWPDDAILATFEDILETATGGVSDAAMNLFRYTIGASLLQRDGVARHRRGLDLIGQAKDGFVRETMQFLVPVAGLWIARDSALHGNPDDGLPVMRRILNDFRVAHRTWYVVWATRVLVEVLAARGTEPDIAEAEQLVARLAEFATEGAAIPRITLLQCEALLARARGDDDFSERADRYLAMAKCLDYEGHIAWANQMLA